MTNDIHDSFNKDVDVRMFWGERSGYAMSGLLHVKEMKHVKM